MTTIRKTLTYDRNLSGHGAVRFANETALLTLLDADHAHLGQPETITVTIEAGEVFRDELDDHITESMLDPGYRAAVRRREAGEAETSETATSADPPITPIADQRLTCKSARFGRSHLWVTGAFLWPHDSVDRQWYIGEDYFICGNCGEIRSDTEETR